MNVERGDVKALKEIAPEYETIKIISDVISKMELKVNNKSFLNFFPYFLKEIYLIYMKSNLDTLFRPFSKKDEVLLKKFN